MIGRFLGFYDCTFYWAFGGSFSRRFERGDVDWLEDRFGSGFECGFHRGFGSRFGTVFEKGFGTVFAGGGGGGGRIGEDGRATGC